MSSKGYLSRMKIKLKIKHLVLTIQENPRLVFFVFFFCSVTVPDIPDLYVCVQKHCKSSGTSGHTKQVEYKMFLLS